MGIKIHSTEENVITLPGRTAIHLSWRTGGNGLFIKRRGQSLEFDMSELGDLIDALTRVIIHESPKPKSECKCGECK